MSQTISQQPLCLRLTMKTVNSVKGLPYVISRVLDLIVDEVIPFPEYSSRFTDVFNNVSRVLKPEVP